MRATIYLHSSKESNYELGEKLGLSGDALRLFSFALCEVKVDVDVESDGNCRIVAVDGKALA
jgi:hypothetical protein